MILRLAQESVQRDKVSEFFTNFLPRNEHVLAEFDCSKIFKWQKFFIADTNTVTFMIRSVIRF